MRAIIDIKAAGVRARVIGIYNCVDNIEDPLLGLCLRVFVLINLL